MRDSHLGLGTTHDAPTMPRYRRLVLAILCALAPLPSTSFLVGDVRQGIPCRAVPSSFFERILDKRPHWRATTHRTAQWMQDPSRQPLASPEDSLSRPASHAKELLRSLAFDATSVNETLWLALLAVFWPFLVLWSMAMSSVRTVEEFIVLLNHIHGEQSGVPTVYVPQGKGPTRMLLGAATTPSSDSIDWTLLRLQVQLQDAVNKEDYATASSLQAAIKETEERSTNKLAKQLLKRTWRMRRERESKATKPLDASALEELIAAAVNEDDFERAAQLRDQLKDLSPSRSEIELLEMDVKRRAVEMFIEETFARQDPILNLTKGIEELVAREEYEEAALLSKELTELKRVRDRKLLMEKLEMSLKRQRQFELDQR